MPVKTPRNGGGILITRTTTLGTRRRRNAIRRIGRLLYWVVEAACIGAIVLFTPILLPIVAISAFRARCPACGSRWMRTTGGIRTSYPTGEGTGISYVCRRCHQEWWWSNYDRHFSPYHRPSETE